MIVMKFGGSSVESAAAIARVAGIVKQRQDRHPVVVVSAMGKTTDYKFVAMGHNTIRGAAGAAVLNAELMQSEGMLLS
jgi:aspartate kinase